MIRERIVEMLNHTVFAEHDHQFTADEIADRVCAIVHDEIRQVVQSSVGYKVSETPR